MSEVLTLGFPDKKWRCRSGWGGPSGSERWTDALTTGVVVPVVTLLRLDSVLANRRLNHPGIFNIARNPAEGGFTQLDVAAMIAGDITGDRETEPGAPRRPDCGLGPVVRRP